MHTIRSEESFYLPALTPGEREDLQVYFSFYEQYRNEISDWAELELKTHPAWGRILESMSQEERLEQRTVSYQAQAAAVFHDKWVPFLAQLNYFGIFYARIGMDFHSWFEVVNLVRRYLKPKLQQQQDNNVIITIMNGMDMYMDIVMSNIGEAYIAEKENIIKQQKEKQIALNKELENFVYIASHDLQEPLNTVESFVGLLESEYGHEFSHESKEILSFIKSSTIRMKELISGLLEYSKVAGNKEFRSVSLKAVVADVCSDLNGRIKQTNATVDVTTALPTICASPIAMKMLFQNLIGNALKFHKIGMAPVVRISAQKEEDLLWHFVVEDNGIGIDPKDKEKVFVIFKRLNEATKYEGTGIGLAHCKKIVESHGGKIWVESVLGAGSQIHFILNEKIEIDEKA